MPWLDRLQRTKGKQIADRPRDSTNYPKQIADHPRQLQHQRKWLPGKALAMRLNQLERKSLISKTTSLCLPQVQYKVLYLTLTRDSS